MKYKYYLLHLKSSVNERMLINKELLYKDILCHISVMDVYLNY